MINPTTKHFLEPNTTLTQVILVGVSGVSWPPDTLYTTTLPPFDRQTHPNKPMTFTNVNLTPAYRDIVDHILPQRTTYSHLFQPSIVTMPLMLMRIPLMQSLKPITSV